MAQGNGRYNNLQGLAFSLAPMAYKKRSSSPSCMAGICYQLSVGSGALGSSLSAAPALTSKTSELLPPCGTDLRAPGNAAGDIEGLTTQASTHCCAAVPAAFLMTLPFRLARHCMHFFTAAAPLQPPAAETTTTALLLTAAASWALTDFPRWS